jgi:RNA polymerase sigma-70 factor (ECF subfamily)
MSEPEDRLYGQILVLRCQTGDTAAFTELVERYGPRLNYYLRKTFGRVDGADDLFQDVWFIVFRKIRDLIDPAAFATWLYQIARNRAYRELRKRRLPALPIDEIGPVADPAAEGPDFTAEDGERVHGALDQLALEHREALVLRFVEGMAYEEIAAITGCGIGTVKSRLHYAKRALRRVLEGATIHE